jgi:hypothetical protein
LAEYFTTAEIVNIFTDANIQTDKSLFAKWRITLVSLRKLTQCIEAIPSILTVFCHPLNFPNPQSRKDLIKKLNKKPVLSKRKGDFYAQSAVMLRD